MEENKLEEKKRDYLIPVSILLSAIIIAVGLIYRAGISATPSQDTKGAISQSGGKSPTSPASSESELPVRWGDLGARLVKAGVIDEEKFSALYAGRGGLSPELKKLLESKDNGNVVINKENAGSWLNLLWALGLGNKNVVLGNGPMTDPRYGGAGNFASTGGWTLAVGNAMDHYSMHEFMNLTPEQQALVDKVTQNIYRPCCNNSTYFPDCNHGMAMLGLMELAASQGANEATLYNIALTVNSFWFPDTYQNIGKFLSQKGIDPASVPAQDILSAQYSSGSGYQVIVAALKPTQNKGSSCGV